MGGYGAMKCALRASDTFSCAASLSGALDIVSHLEGQPESGLFYDIFGTSEETKGSFNDLFAAASELKESGKPLPSCISGAAPRISCTGTTCGCARTWKSWVRPHL